MANRFRTKKDLGCLVSDVKGQRKFLNLNLNLFNPNNHNLLKDILK